MYKCSNKLKRSKRSLKRVPFLPCLPEFIWSKWLIGRCFRCFVSPADLRCTEPRCLRTAGSGVVMTETLKSISDNQEMLMNIWTILLKLCKNSLKLFSSSSSHSLQPYSVIFCNQEGRIRSASRMYCFVGVIILFETHGGVIGNENIVKLIWS